MGVMYIRKREKKDKRKWWACVVGLTRKSVGEYRRRGRRRCRGRGMCVKEGEEDECGKTCEKIW